MWESKETLEGGLRIDRMWRAAVKVGAIVAVSVLVAIATALAFLYPRPTHHPGRGVLRLHQPHHPAPVGDPAEGAQAQRRGADLRQQPSQRYGRAFAERHAPHRPHQGAPDEIDVRLLDHIVVSPTETVNMAARGLI